MAFEARAQTQAEWSRAQAALNILGFNVGVVDGIPGNATRSALAAYQQSIGQPPSGNLTADTAVSLFEIGIASTAFRVEPSFDCARAQSPSEKAICASDELSRLDRALSEAYKKAFSQQASGYRETFKGQQIAWIAGRDQCGGDALCLAAAISQRIEVLAPGRFRSVIAANAIPTTRSEQAAKVTVAPPVGGSQKTLSLAATLSLPVRDGHIFSPHPMAQLNSTPAVGDVIPGAQDAPDLGWQRLSTLAMIGRDPDRFREGSQFVNLAALFLEGESFTNFFTNPGDVPRALARGSVEMWRRDGVFPFGDEFGYEDARQKFFDTIYPQIVALAPEWPLPILHVVRVQLQPYDASLGGFPIYFPFLVGETALVSASFPASKGDYGSSNTIASGDRLVGATDVLRLAETEARRLREVLPQDGSIYLAWYADLDWTQDGSDIDSQFAPRDANVRMPRGRAVVKQVGYFLDPGLKTPIQMLDPKALAETTAQDPVSALTDGQVVINAVKLISDSEILKWAEQDIGSAFIKPLIFGSNEARRASEFDRASVVESIQREFDRIRVGEFWFLGGLQLGEYDLNDQSFDISSQPVGVSYRKESPLGAKAQLSLLGQPPFGKIRVPVDTARLIVERYGRRVGYYLLVDPQTASYDDRVKTVTIAALPKHIVFFFEDTASQEKTVIYEQPFVSAATDMPEVEGLDGLAEIIPPLNLHTLHLLLVAKSEKPLSDAQIDEMMQMAYRAQANGFDVPIAPFFEKLPAQLGKAEMAYYRDRFKSWVKAKGDALGNRFRLEINPSPYQLPADCKAAIRLSEGNTHPIQDVVGWWSIPEANRDFARATSKLAVTYRMPKDYAWLPGVAQVGNQNCTGTEFQALIQVQNSVVSGNAMLQRRFVTGEISALELVETGGVLPSIRLVMDVEKTEVAMVNDRSSEPVLSLLGTRTTPVFEPQPVAAPAPPQVPKYKVGQVPAPGAAQETAVTPQNSAPQVEQKDVTPDVTVAKLDVVGLRTGMMLEEAEKIILKEFRVAAAYTSAAVRQADFKALAHSRLYFTDQGQETIVLHMPTPQGPVVGISRHYVSTNETLPIETIKSRLIEKYGEPEGSGEALDFLFWPDPDGCSAMPLVPLGLQNYNPVQGVASGGQLPADTYQLRLNIGSIATLATGGNRDFLITTDCKTVTQFGSEPLVPRPGASEFYIVQFDIGMIKKMEGVQEEATEDDEIKL